MLARVRAPRSAVLCGAPRAVALVAADGHIYAANEQGTFYVVAAAEQFQLLATNRLDEQCLATPAIADGDLFLRTAGHVYCVGAK